MYVFQLNTHSKTDPLGPWTVQKETRVLGADRLETGTSDCIQISINQKLDKQTLACPPLCLPSTRLTLFCSPFKDGSWTLKETLILCIYILVTSLDLQTGSVLSWSVSTCWTQWVSKSQLVLPDVNCQFTFTNYYHIVLKNIAFSVQHFGKLPQIIWVSIAKVGFDN